MERFRDFVLSILIKYSLGWMAGRVYSRKHINKFLEMMAGRVYSRKPTNKFLG
jgi:hypothetical protein